MRTGRGSVALAVVLAASLAAGCGPSRDEVLSGVSASVLDPPFDKPDFTFTDTHGRPWDFKEATRGKLALLYFGYTHCPDVCPLTMARLASAMDSVPPELKDRIAVVFVSVDPKRDTPARIGAWLAGFDSTFVGLSAPQDRVDAVVRALQFPATSFPDGTEGDSYTVTHPGMVMGFTPDGEGRLMWFPTTSTSDFKNDLTSLASYSW